MDPTFHEHRVLSLFRTREPKASPLETGCGGHRFTPITFRVRGVG
ncbi:MAG TPA: hypothetical protein VF968_08425 [Actinomycetota bacterium]